VASAADYHPFGWEMPERTHNSTQYRYGFNGKEKDQNLEFGSQTVYDYGFRIYNPAIGKFLSVDPLTREYPSWSPYAFAMNMPIAGIDLDGLEVFLTYRGELIGKLGKDTEIRVVDRDYLAHFGINELKKFVHDGCTDICDNSEVITSVIARQMWGDGELSIWESNLPVIVRSFEQQEKVQKWVDEELEPVLIETGAVLLEGAVTLMPLGKISKGTKLPKNTVGAARNTERTGGYRLKFRKDGLPYAKPGPKVNGGPHNNVRDRLIKDMEAAGFKHTGGGSLSEIIVETKGGIKDFRRMDVSFEHPKTGKTIHFQIGVRNKRGDPIIREREAISDVKNFADKKDRNVLFIPYKIN